MRGPKYLLMALSCSLMVVSLAARGRADVQLQAVSTGPLSGPTFVTHAGDSSNRLFIVENVGTIKVLQPGGSAATEFLNINTLVACCGERGLLGLAFHPFFRNNRRFYVYYTRVPDGALVIAEYRATPGNPNDADESSARILLEIPHPTFSNHNGGMLAFGPDGLLYAATGDGGSGNDPGNNAQNINSLLGKILRLDVDHMSGQLQYAIPPDNPFAGPTPGADEIYAFGLRNTWRFSFDPANGVIWGADVGQNAIEEINHITRGGNYGWRVFEGTRCTGNDPSICTTNDGQSCNINGYTCPVAEYAHTAGRCSITGGYVYRGALGTFNAGTYLYGDYCTGEIFKLEGGASSLVLDTDLNFELYSFGVDELGEIYVVGGNGTLWRLVDPARPCAFAINPSTRSFATAADSGTLAVASTAGCAWTAASNAAWIEIASGASGSGAGAVSFRVEANQTGAPRSGTITVAGRIFTIFQGQAFADVPATDIFYSEIGRLSARGVTVGCGGGNYCPDQPVTREQMSAFLMRALGEFNPPPPAMQRFQDVLPTNFFYAFIDRLAVLGITLGCGPNIYCPADTVTREQMAAFLARALGSPAPPAPPSQAFADVPPTSYFFNYIDWLFTRGVTRGCNGSNYCPFNPVTRGEMAAFLVRAFGL
jgi:hypothetical protein